ncbi:MAG: glycosyltransferase [Candidatus Nanoarchaeia archaeon]
MFEIYIWILCFISLYVSIFWLIIVGLGEPKEPQPLKEIPKVTVVVPAYNEEKNIAKTLDSILNLDYPKDKLKIIVADDASTDNTPLIIKEYCKKHKNIKLIQNKINSGNAAGTLNASLQQIDTEFFARVDSDSFVDKNSLKLIINHFSDPEIGAIISSVLINNDINYLGRIQRLEYILSSFVRKLISRIGALHMTHGVMTVYRTNLIKKLGGFDKNNLTEDLEVALKLRYNKYNVIIEPRSINYTNGPLNLKAFWKQRVRWFRGFITNNWKYKKMFFNKNYGLIGLFQLPLNVTTMLMVLFSFILFAYQFLRYVYTTLIKIITLGFGMFDFIIEWPSVKDFILSLDIRIWFPVIASFIFGFYIYIYAHKYFNQKWKFHFITLIYLLLYPMLRSLQWMNAFVLEAFGAKRKW